MSRTFRYPTLHWLMTLVVAPVLLLAYVFGTEGWPGIVDEGMMTFLTFVVFGAVLSVPTYVLYLVVFIRLFERIRSPLVLKVVCNVFVIGCAGLTFWWMDGSAMPSFFLMYSVAVVISSILLKIRPIAKPVVEKVD